MCILTAWLKTIRPMCLCSAHSFHLHAIHDVCVIVCWLRPRSVFLLFLSVVYFVSSTLYLHSDQHFLSNANSVEGTNRCALAQRGVLPYGEKPSSHRLRAQRPRRLPLLRDFCKDLPGWIQRHRYGTLVLVSRGTRRWHYRKSAILTTVHSGARRTSGPKTSSSLSWRKFVVSSVLFRRDPTRTQFVSKTKIKSRNGKRKNQDSPWKTKEQILAEVWSEVQKHELQAESGKLVILQQGVSNPGEVNYHFKENYQNKIGIFVTLVPKVFMRWKNWREFKSYESMNLREEYCLKIKTR